MSRFVRRLSAALGALAVAASLASAAPAAGGTTTTPDPHFGEPTVGDCYNYGWSGWMAGSITRTPVSCSTSHTAKVIKVVQLPDHLSWDSPVQTLANFATKTCSPAYRSFLGRTESLRLLSAYAFGWYVPTQAQKDQGARWVRCDLVLPSGRALMPIRRNTVPILHAAPLPRSVAKCLAGEDLYPVVCAKPHRFKATGTYRVDRATYPSRDTWVALARQKCPARTNTRVWIANWPPRLAFLLGNFKSITCYSRHSL